jgi:hypothetical protein
MIFILPWLVIIATVHAQLTVITLQLAGSAVEHFAFPLCVFPA